MPTKQEWFKRLFDVRPPAIPPPIPAGIHHTMRDVEGVQTRFHLRVERDGSGMLLANSNAAARLSQAGVVIAKGLLFDGASEGEILSDLESRFRGASRAAMRRDVEQVRSLIAHVATPGSDYPIMNFDDIAFLAHDAQLIAPLKVDMPLAPPEQMVPLIDRLWKVGVPNMTILVPENPTPDHMLRAIERAEDLGMIAGVRGRGSDLGQGNLVYDMAMAGVDYVTVLYTSAYRNVHDPLCGTGDLEAAERVIEQTRAYEVCPVAEVALVESTLEALPGTLDHFSELDIDTVSFFAIYCPNDDTAALRQGALPVRSLPPIEVMLAERADNENRRFIWQPPLPYEPARPLTRQVREGPRCSGSVAIRVEPDGSVIPSEGPYQSVGNLLSDSWQKIWGNPAFLVYREQVEAPAELELDPTG
jgi:hypothetical protein